MSCKSVSTGTTASGAAVPGVSLRRADGDHHRWHAADRTAYTGVRAKYDDLTTRKTGEVLAGTDSGNGVKVLRTTYSSKANALRGARSEFQKLARGAVTFEYALARGRPDVYPGMRCDVRGFKPDIDSAEWTVVKAEHQLSGSGLTTRLELEIKPEGVDSAPESDVE